MVVYLHGGYWQALHKDDSSFLAGPLAAHGISLAAVGYSLCPSVSLDELVAQVQCCVRYLRARFPRRPLHLVGHSAGAHLAAMVLLLGGGMELEMPYELSADEDEEEDGGELGVELGEKLNLKISGALLVSGIYDLMPLFYSKENKVRMSSLPRVRPTALTRLTSDLPITKGIRLTDEEAVERNSPLSLLALSQAHKGSQVRTMVLLLLLLLLLLLVWLLQWLLLPLHLSLLLLLLTHKGSQLGLVHKDPCSKSRY